MFYFLSLYTTFTGFMFIAHVFQTLMNATVNHAIMVVPVWIWLAVTAVPAPISTLERIVRHVSAMNS